MYDFSQISYLPPIYKFICILIPTVLFPSNSAKEGVLILLTGKPYFMWTPFQQCTHMLYFVFRNIYLAIVLKKKIHSNLFYHCKNLPQLYFSCSFTGWKCNLHSCLFLTSWTLLKLQEFNFPMSLSATFLSLNPEWSSSAHAHTHLILHLSGIDAINYSFSFLFKTQSLPWDYFDAVCKKLYVSVIIW